MKNQGLLNKEIITEVAGLGHTQYLCVADPGLPIPKGVKVIDVSVCAGIPRFLDVVDAVCGELVVESTILASEIDEKSAALSAELNARFGDLPMEKVPHEDFKKLTEKAMCIIRTGETVPYATIILVGGVNF